MSTRLATPGRLIETSTPLNFTFNGKNLRGYAGDTLASALMANDIRLVGRSFKDHRPRGVMTAGSEEPNALVGADTDTPSKRVYVAYLDSVEHFRPRELRTSVYHEILVTYLATARARGYSHAHIWSCPPSRGNSFVFWGHPPLQRTPTKDRLLSWYHRAICHGFNRGVITYVKSLYEHAFEEYEKESHNNNNKSNRSKNKAALEESQPIMVCPPILEGDFWLEEASRVHSSSVARYF